MPIEIPDELIKQVQIAVLQEANLSSYDPDVSSLPSLPSLESSISELDPSPPHLRCKNCNGRLLRGEISFICVFCGNKQNQEEGPPQPINFKNTLGCRWFLNYLGLDGSETVGFPVKANESNRRQNAIQEEFPLSHLLDLEIEWLSEFENLEKETNRSILSSVGVHLDNSSSEGKPDTISAVSEEQLALKKNDNNIDAQTAFQASNSLSLFENVETSETSVRSTDKNVGGSFDSGKARFQSTGREVHHEEPKSVDPVVGSKPDLSAHMDSVFGVGNNLFDGKNNENIDSPAPSTSEDWFQNDPLHGKSSNFSGPNLSSKSNDLTQASELQSQSKVAPNDERIENEDDSFGAWNDFTSSTPTENPSSKQAGLFDMNENLKDSGKVETANTSSSKSVDITNAKKVPDVKTVDEEDDSFDDWNDFASSSNTKGFELTSNVNDGKSVENANPSSSTNLGWFQNGQLEIKSNEATDNKSGNLVDDDLFGGWNDFSGSTSTQDPSKIQIDLGKFEVNQTVRDGGNLEKQNIPLIEDDLWPASMKKDSNNKTKDEANDLFDTWNDFTSSMGAQGLLNKQTADVKDHGIMGVDSSFEWFQADQLPISNSKEPEAKSKDKEFDLLDGLHDYKISLNAQASSVSIEQASGNNILEPESSLQEMDFGSISQGGFSGQNGSTEVTVTTSQHSVSVRNANTNAYDKDGGDAKEGEKGGAVSNEASSSKTNDAETLISQMHDLSFMLKSDLSIPPKQ